MKKALILHDTTGMKYRVQLEAEGGPAVGGEGVQAEVSPVLLYGKAAW